MTATETAGGGLQPLPAVFKPEGMLCGRVIESDLRMEIVMTPEQIEKKLADLGKLKRNWDSYGGDPIDPAILSAVDYLLRRMPATMLEPLIVPTSNGGIQLEWHRGKNRGLELEFMSSAKIEFLQFSKDACGEAFVEGPVDADNIDRIIELYNWFVSFGLPTVRTQ